MIPSGIDTVFGAPKTTSRYSDCKFIVRHGFFSDHRPFIPLSKELTNRFSGSTVDNRDYVWKKPVIENGIELALTILNDYEDTDPICLIGHSMGGLVCRVANVALTQTSDLQRHLKLLAGVTGMDFFKPANSMAAGLRGRKVAGMVTLATPNSATLTYGQIAGWMKAVGAAAPIGFPNKTASFVDLTTDRLFKFLQFYGVNTPTLCLAIIRMVTLSRSRSLYTPSSTARMSTTSRRPNTSHINYGKNP
jgi:hypothetical protein